MQFSENIKATGKTGNGLAAMFMYHCNSVSLCTHQRKKYMKKVEAQDNGRQACLG
jgi:hypothetical protein